MYPITSGGKGGNYESFDGPVDETKKDLLQAIVAAISRSSGPQEHKIHGVDLNLCLRAYLSKAIFLTSDSKKFQGQHQDQLLQSEVDPDICIPGNFANAIALCHGRKAGNWNRS